MNILNLVQFWLDTFDASMCKEHYKQTHLRHSLSRNKLIANLMSNHIFQLAKLRAHPHVPSEAKVETLYEANNQQWSPN
jgi:hypothetical protein